MNNIFNFLKDKSREEKAAISAKMWPNSAQKTRDVRISEVISGKPKFFKIAWVRIICDKFRLDPNTLFGYPWRKKVIIKKKKSI